MNDSQANDEYIKAKDHVQVLDVFFALSENQLSVFRGNDIPKNANPVIAELEDSDGWSHAWFFDLAVIGRGENPNGWHLQFDKTFDANLNDAVMNCIKYPNALTISEENSGGNCNMAALSFNGYPFDELPYSFDELPEDVRVVFLALANQKKVDEMDQKVFCAPGRLGIIDVAVEREDGVLVGQISKETIEELWVRYPGVVVDTMDAAIARRNVAMTHSPTEITEEQFFSALHCLPPMGWVQKGNAESFKMSEFTSGAITGIYARVDDRYFTMSDVYTMKHEDIVSACAAVFPELQITTDVNVLPEIPSLDETVERMKSEILADINAAKVSPAVKSFGELFDFVDANVYGGFCNDEFVDALIAHFDTHDTDENVHVNRMNYGSDARIAVSMWIANGGIREAIDLSSNDAEKIAAEKAMVEYANPYGTKVYDGKVMDVTGMHVVMSLGRAAVICDQRFLDRVPAKGEEVVVSFVGGGLGEVSAVVKGLGSEVGR